MDKEFTKELEEKREDILKQIEEWNEKGFFEINGREYKLSKMTHQFRLEVLAIYSQIEAPLTMGNYGFLLNDEFKTVAKKLDDRILFDNVQISKRANHWDTYEEDYIDYISLAMKVISFPFYKKKLNIN